MRLERQPPPDVLLFQETRTPNLTLPCYSFYTNPTIVTTPRPNERNPETKKGWAAVAVLRHIPHAQLDTASLCTGKREVVEVRLSHKRRRMTLASVYIRPATATEDDKEATAWIGELVGLAEGDPIVIAGDFNARHKDWGYASNTRKGRQIIHGMKTAGLTLRNEPGAKTRIGMCGRQKDSSPDLSWATARVVLDWSTWKDSLGSDHFPIEMKIDHGRSTNGKERRPVVKWDRFRELLGTSEN